MTKASDNAFPSILITEGTEPSAPAAGKQRLYIDSTTHKLKRTNSSGTDVDIESTTSGATSWAAYTPTWTAVTTNPTLGSTTIAGRWKMLETNTMVFFINVAITTGGAWNAGSGEWQFSLPSGKTAPAFRQTVAGMILDNGTKRYVITGLIEASDTKIIVMAVSDASNPFTVGASAPVTWATGDKLDIGGIIEIA